MLSGSTSDGNRPGHGGIVRITAASLNSSDGSLADDLDPAVMPPRADGDQQQYTRNQKSDRNRTFEEDHRVSTRYQQTAADIFLKSRCKQEGKEQHAAIKNVHSYRYLGAYTNLGYNVRF
jgi:hypothetical protein